MRYKGVSVSINISAIQILNPDFTGRLFDLMEDMQIDPESIGIEITESVFASDYEYINKHIDKLRDAGIYIAIDDFGTGYSSLAREKELRVDLRKNRQAFY
jgi:EAL domain-containing protein (putative c-di-GMP-specific phosphodiesterase class I)